jgi:hypothetical protein
VAQRRRPLTGVGRRSLKRAAAAVSQVRTTGGTPSLHLRVLSRRSLDGHTIVIRLGTPRNLLCRTHPYHPRPPAILISLKLTPPGFVPLTLVSVGDLSATHSQDGLRACPAM